MTSLTTAATTTDRTSVSSGNTVFLTIAELSIRHEAERATPSEIASHGKRPAIRNSGKEA